MLGLNGSRKWSYDELANQDRIFYENESSTPPVLSKFSMVNITGETLQAGLDQLANLDLLRAAQKKERKKERKRRSPTSHRRSGTGHGRNRRVDEPLLHDSEDCPGQQAPAA